MKKLSSFLYVYLVLFFTIPPAVGAPNQCMNILFILNKFPVISHTFMYNQITGMLDAGHKTAIFSCNKGYLDVVHPDVNKYNLLEKTIYNEFPTDIASFDTIVCQLARIGKKYIDIKASGAFPGTFAVCFRGSDGTENISKNNNEYQRIFKHADLLLPVCDYFKKLLVEAGANPHKITVHHSGINLEKFAFRAAIPSFNKSIELVTVARLVEKKGLEYSIKAVVQLIKKYPHIHYTIIGDGPLKKDLESIIEKNNTQSHITLVGRKTCDEVIKILHKSHIFILPSITATDRSCEGIPNVLMEAMAIGLPCISTYHGGIPELIKNTETGFLVPEKDIAALSRAIEYLIQNPNAWKNVTFNARAQVVREHDIAKQNKKLERLLKASINTLKNEKIKLYTFYTPSHEKLFKEWFKPSIKDDFELVVQKYPQECPTASFWQKGWQETMLHKVNLILQAIDENWGKIFIYADIDIQFFRPMQELIIKAMKDKDIVFQQNNPSGEVCAGFLACKGNEKTKALWENVKKLMLETNHPSDQKALNCIIQSPSYKGVTWGYLPVEFFGAGTLTGQSWIPGQNLSIPNNIVLHHDNYIKGIKNKIKQLNYVKKEFEYMQKKSTSQLEKQKLNILFVTDLFPVESRPFINNQISGLLDGGHNVWILSKKRRDPQMTPSLQKYSLESNIFYKHIPEKKFDVILCQFGFLGKWVRFLIKEHIISGKFIMFLRGEDISGLLKRNPKMYTELFHEVDLFLPVCNFFKKKIIDMGCSPTKITVLHSAINCDQFPYNEHRFQLNSAINILTAARLCPKKGLEYTIQAIAQLKNRYPTISYTILGDGPLKEDLEMLVHTLGAEKYIHMPGKLSHDEVAKTLAKSHIFMLASVTAKDGHEEGIPNALMEAMASGLPVIGTYHAGIPELIKDNESGFLIPEKNIEALVEKISYLIEHPNLCVTMGKKGRDYVEKEHNREVENDKLEKMLYKIVEQR